MTSPRLDQELQRWAAVKEMLAGEDLDDQTLLDTLEGATDLLECLAAIDEAIVEDEARLIGLKTVLDKLRDRSVRFASGIERKRHTILRAMERAGLTTVKTPTATLTVRRVAPGLVVRDDSEIPGQYWTPQSPKLDRKALAHALKNGVSVSGCGLDNGDISLTIRRG